MGQGATLISALWGLLVWKEFKGADLRIKLLLAVMLVLFGCGLTLVSLAPLYAGRSSSPRRLIPVRRRSGRARRTSANLLR